MKRSKFMLLVIGAAIIFSGYTKDDSMAADLQNDLKTTSLNYAKVKKTFKGKSTPVEMTAEINKWHDATDDWRVTGTTIWVTAADGFKGTAELFVDARNPNDKNRGRWEIKWEGKITIGKDGKSALVVATADGKGVEGKVKGMTATWIYTMNYVGDLSKMPDPTNPTCFYTVEGKVEKP
jgi:hypothetical protein